MHEGLPPGGPSCVVERLCRASPHGHRVLSPAFGFTAGWMFLAGKIAAAGTVAIGLAGYLNAPHPGAPSARLAETAAPLQLAALNFPYPWVATAVSVGGVTAMLGVILSQLRGLSRMGFAGGISPSSSRRFTPVTAFQDERSSPSRSPCPSS